MGPQLSEKRSIGASMKYGWLLNLTKDEELYTAAKITKLGYDPQKDPKAYERTKRAIWQFAKYHHFHTTIDGKSGRFDAWYGWRWKESARPEDLRQSPPPGHGESNTKRSKTWLPFLVIAASFLIVFAAAFFQLSRPEVQSFQEYALAQRKVRMSHQPWRFPRFTYASKEAVCQSNRQPLVPFPNASLPKARLFSKRLPFVAYPSSSSVGAGGDTGP